jgi:cytosine/adenosine deaminase-related metal-dependent hydrolase
MKKLSGALRPRWSWGCAMAQPPCAPNATWTRKSGCATFRRCKKSKSHSEIAVTLQIVAFPQQGLLRHPATLDLFREAFRCGADIVGAAANIESERPFQEHIDAAFRPGFGT